jgi:hypothetical protein
MLGEDDRLAHGKERALIGLLVHFRFGRKRRLGPRDALQHVESPLDQHLDLGGDARPREGVEAPVWLEDALPLFSEQIEPREECCGCGPLAIPRVALDLVVRRIRSDEVDAVRRHRLHCFKTIPLN